MKNVVYEIKCSTCGTAYIRETSRTIETWIKEHLTREKQTVFKSLLLHKKHKGNKIVFRIRLPVSVFSNIPFVLAVFRMLWGCFECFGRVSNAFGAFGMFWGISNVLGCFR